MKSGSNLEKVLEAGHFAVTAELGPPMSASGEEVKHKMEILRGNADAFNITDCQTAVVRLSSIASAIMLIQGGMEPVMQMTTRDRNRIAIQADILGACAFGIKNCLSIAGDHQSFSAAGRLKGHPGARNVYDVDSIQLCAILKKMRDEGLTEGGDPIEEPPKLFIGAAWTPMADPFDFRVIRLAKKAEAGADFIQTQGVYDVKQFADVMKEVRKLGAHERTAILAGIIVPRSAGMLRYMNASVAGVTVPDELIKRFPRVKKGASKEAKRDARIKSEEIGKQIAVELIEQVREIEGVSGVHIQGIEWEKAVPEIVKAAGLLPRPTV
ncbi:MAG: methylenetetrahydrofolate reductase [Candidatus Brocadiae bacterium]|nr:methylenetetrahydrofolate reductase [Candidatus Brocadiia bacterium]